MMNHRQHSKQKKWKSLEGGAATHIATTNATKEKCDAIPSIVWLIMAVAAPDDYKYGDKATKEKKTRMKIISDDAISSLRGALFAAVIIIFHHHIFLSINLGRVLAWGGKSEDEKLRQRSGYYYWSVIFVSHYRQKALKSIRPRRQNYMSNRYGLR